MKYYVAKFSIPKLIFFLVISSLGLTAHAREQCQEIKVYTSGGCGSVNMCSSGKEVTQKISYEVPDGAGPIPDGPGAGVGAGPSTGGGDSAEDQARKETEAKKKAELEKYCRSRPAEIDLRQQICLKNAIDSTNTAKNQCSNLSFQAAWYFGISYTSNCRDFWAGEQESRKQECNVDAAQSKAELSKQCP